MIRDKKSCLYGFEDYKVLILTDSHLFADYSATVPMFTDSSSVTYMTVDDSLPVQVGELYYGYTHGIRFIPNLYENHPELLDNAKKVYIHPSCNLSRSMVAEKYKKSLNPWLSGAVVMPKLSGKECCIQDAVIFANDDAKLIVIVMLYDGNNIVQSTTFQVGKRFGDLCKHIPNNYGNSTYGYTLEQVLVSELFFVGKCLTIPNSQSHILDALTHSIPTSKVVLEQTMQESLGTEENKLDLDVLVNIHDMLNSSDAETVGAGLKALSMMDYMHYPNSIRYIIKTLDSVQYRYNRAANSTSVKFMFKQLSESSKRNYWPGSYDSEIYEQDYELYKQLISHYEPNYKDNVIKRLKSLAFMTINVDGLFVPRLKS